MEKRVIPTLYRHVLKKVVMITRMGAGRIALDRYAEYLPTAYVVAEGDGLSSIARKVFEETPLKACNVTNGFHFVKDVTDSVLDLEVLALWDAYTRKGECELLEGIAIVSAALRLAGVPEAKGDGDMTTLVNNTLCGLQSIVSDIRGILESSDFVSKVHRRRSYMSFLRSAVSVLQERGYSVSELVVEECSAESLVCSKKASAIVMNAVLVVVLRELGLQCTLAGVELQQPWIRVEKSNRAPIFLSFARAGAYTAEEVIGFAHESQRTHRSLHFTPWGMHCRRQILLAMLKRQLMMLSSDPKVSVVREKQQHMCQTQILFLLS
ncbi:hypothetical protein, conserved [Trypanosoma brucei gambiense DAL972]|uniref:Uncharacterized protein n=2 Tax=Trypanosoma brucei TaxID=5691 RepID=C9ZN34_TRYB9|nr:hypothetical protein, conserved [Trypanosoma brucei gambiense DAL972]RHW73155.1 hypothetical protein DPX39_040069200 [Trypanosoma brucei equiperdum]CBH10688.1 hypothetical protein, conserved [Trypanosoma brucei gambiense DAL972]|eukprot:XP_011772976.1 hypothetical protein, conserved [Trypanosoma brucei gambiense DAL972]